jgi:multiple RNA-binding domain-containing protein 1
VAIDREEEEDEADCEPETTLFVKNLNFETNDADLRSKFETIAKVKSAMVSRKRDASNPEKALSMGFGFVQYYRQAATQRALKELQVPL